MMEKAATLLLTKDYWMLMGNDNYLGVITHYVHENWNCAHILTIITEAAQCIQCIQIILQK